MRRARRRRGLGPRCATAPRSPRAAFLERSTGRFRRLCWLAGRAVRHPPPPVAAPRRFDRMFDHRPVRSPPLPRRPPLNRHSDVLGRVRLLRRLTVRGCVVGVAGRSGTAGRDAGRRCGRVRRPVRRAVSRAARSAATGRAGGGIRRAIRWVRGVRDLRCSAGRRRPRRAARSTRPMLPKGRRGRHRARRNSPPFRPGGGRSIVTVT